MPAKQLGSKLRPMHIVYRFPFVDDFRFSLRDHEFYITVFVRVICASVCVCVCAIVYCLFFQWNCLSSLYFINWKWSRKNEIYTKNTKRCNCLHKTHFSARCEFEYLLAPQAIHLITIILNFLATLLPFDHSKSTSMPYDINICLIP